MTNRQKLIQTNIYDLLYNLNKALIVFRCDCIVAALTDGEKTYDIECSNKCRECIAKWLDVEVE